MPVTERRAAKASAVPPADSFAARHIGPSAADVAEMLRELGQPSLDALVDAAVPKAIRSAKPLKIGRGLSEGEALAELRALAAKNQVFRSYLGLGYHDTITPPVVLRGILENPGWYTAYTPYQAEIAQGRLEALLNFQTMVIGLTGLPVANASLLDEATAAAEAMTMARALRPDQAPVLLVSDGCHPQTIEVVRTRAEPLGVSVVVGPEDGFDLAQKPFAVLLQYPRSEGAVLDYEELAAKAREAGALVVVAADLLALTLLRAPGEWGADVVVGSAQRFGVPLGYGGPHAAFFATRDEYKRQMPGRIVGVSKDAAGKPALRLALQTREQHIRREKATSNICTAQVLLAVVASMYAVYHGPEGLKRIASRVHALAALLAEALRKLGHRVDERPFFDTIRVEVGTGAAKRIAEDARARRINLRVSGPAVIVALDETVSEKDVEELIALFSAGKTPPELSELEPEIGYSAPFARSSAFMTEPVFNKHRSESEMLRYIKRLEAKDLSLTTSMIPLGSCTMKLNAASEMLAITWPEFGRLHPFAPVEQAQGYAKLFKQLEDWLAEITGFAAVSLQPNAGSQGEYAGLLAIRAYHRARGQEKRDVCLIPLSAHGTNPASAALAGMRIVTVATLSSGDVDLEDLRAKAQAHKDDLSCAMITYPSTHGVYEEGIKEFCEIVHANGGQVYMDGANMNAQVGLCRPGELGADVCHLNLHKTFCIPHGGGGPGMGPIAVAKHLAPFLPGHPVVPPAGEHRVGAVSAAPWGSASILPISWSYIAQMGGQGLTEATKIAILSANYLAKRLAPHYPVLYKGRAGLVAHECILDVRPMRVVAVEDIAKRLMDYGFHAPTISFPVPGTMMVEPTESESKAELDRFCEALIAIREEIRELETGKADKTDNVLKNAPHTLAQVCADEWRRPYSREKAAFPAPWLKDHKYWPAVARIDNAYGDRNFFCSCSGFETE